MLNSGEEQEELIPTMKALDRQFGEEWQRRAWGEEKS
jgi:hypothetical protein